MSTENATAGRKSILGIVVHLVGLFFGVFGVGLFYLLSRGAFSKANARNALSWQLFVLITLVGLLVVFFTATSDVVGVSVGLLLFVVIFLDVAFSLWATFKASKGTVWKYPFVPTVI